MSRRGPVVEYQMQSDRGCVVVMLSHGDETQGVRALLDVVE